ncbi:MAG: dNTP triphosphohydrolase [Planctomycetota bacterium]|nr:dNTP triphosphohydrolase [Planctomycetota bacterium]
MTPESTESADPARYAVLDADSRGRVHPEPERIDRPFEFDRYRTLSCTAFRRLLKKTQVFVSGVSDHFRTRLTHTLEVEFQARSLARSLRLNEALAGAVALAHDLGHSPFGHAGEAALDLLMREHGGFEHNVQSLRVVDYLEHPYPAFRGLNLSFELRESLVKHRTRYDRPNPDGRSDPLIGPLLEVGPGAPLEGQVANLADVMAYTLHDVEDGIGDGALDESALAQSVLWRDASEGIGPGSALRAIRRPILDRLANRLLGDAAAESRRRIGRAGIGTVQDVRNCESELVAFSPGVEAGVEELHRVLVERVYRNHRVVRMDSKARRIIRDLFEAYLAETQLIPERFRERIPDQGAHRVICDYIAGMTDPFCQLEHQRVFAPFHFE